MNRSSYSELLYLHLKVDDYVQTTECEIDILRIYHKFENVLLLCNIISLQGNSSLVVTLHSSLYDLRFTYFCIIICSDCRIKVTNLAPTHTAQLARVRFSSGLQLRSLNINVSNNKCCLFVYIKTSACMLKY